MFLNKLVAVIIGLCSIATTSNGLILNCEYLFLSHSSIGELYTCKAKVFFIEETKYVVDVSHNHLVGLNNSDVKGFVLDQKLDFAPRGINIFYPNLESFVMLNAGSTELTSESLKGLTNLKMLDFAGNNISEVGPDLFVDNSLIELIYLENNPIRHIAYHVFDKLDQLRSLHFYSTDCTNSGVTNNRTAIDNLRFRLFVSCPPHFEMTETKIISGVALEGRVDIQIEKAIEPLYEIIHEIEEELDQLDKRVQILEESDNSLLK